MSEGRTIVVKSLYGMRTQQPRIQITCQEADFTAQLSPAEARDVAINLIEACAAAEFDVAIVRFLRDDVAMGDDDESVAKALTLFRKRLAQVGSEWLPR